VHDCWKTYSSLTSVINFVSCIWKKSWIDAMIWMFLQVQLGVLTHVTRCELFECN
jgi:hypothetical protein